MRVRNAHRGDLSAIAEIARRGWFATYAGLLAHDTITSVMATTYAPGTLETRLTDHPMFVVDVDGAAVAFADALVHTDHIIIADLLTDDGWRRRGCGAMLIERVSDLAPFLPTMADIYLGNEPAERFYERSGFVPGETIQRNLFGQQIVERRWWRPPIEASDIPDPARRPSLDHADQVKPALPTTPQTPSTS